MQCWTPAIAGFDVGRCNSRPSPICRAECRACAVAALSRYLDGKRREPTHGGMIRDASIALFAAFGVRVAGCCACLGRDPGAAR
jgi:hypothetical protein